MFEKIIRFAIEHRWLVLLAVLGMAALGVFTYQRLPIDAVPDITNVQVQINTEAPGYSPLESEQRVTFPIETAMAGLPNLEQTRSLSRYGLSQVTVVFKDGTNIYFARQLVNERIQEARAKLPGGLTPTLGPIATGLGEIYMWTVEAKDGALKTDGTPYTPTDLREIQDWIIKPQLRNVPGVTEINTIGGYAKEYQVAPSPDKLVAHGLSLADIVQALERNNGNVGAGYIERRGEQYLIRAPGQLAGIEDIADIVVSNAQGVPIRVRDLAEVVLGKELRTGAATENGREVVLGTVFMLMGENSRTVSQAVDKKMVEINRSLPEGVPLPFANRQWKRLITEGGQVDRRRYETAIMATLRDRLRAGDIWVEGTRNYRRFDTYLLSRRDADKVADSLPFQTDAAAYLEERARTLDWRLRRFAKQLKANRLAGVAQERPVNPGSGWLPLYLPELFRTSVRATGQGFGFNFGRILAAIGALQTGALMGLFKDGATLMGYHFTGGYPLACSTMSMVYLIGMGLIWLAPETRGKLLPE